jgi:hypothetical protein
MFWCLWYIDEGRDGHDSFPWPIWPMLGWGIGILFEFLNAYVITGTDAVEKEYEKLKRK